jgi:hypothetical protein
MYQVIASKDNKLKAAIGIKLIAAFLFNIQPQ